ncbi:MAG: polymerase, sigma-24 subunit, subfamily [Verrucomicrobiales bacterium]|nr:polymerase, sigma-24 subunit, subfamily [Verrucomicrobiales bacterium]
MNIAANALEHTGQMGGEAACSGREQPCPDADLLRAYVTERNEHAFTTLVRRHWSLVYGVAYRRTGNAALAQDITQAVFILLNRKCADFSNGTILVGWLFRTAMFTTRNVLKIEARRKEREERAALEFDANEATPVRVWEVISKHLDEGLAALSPVDRAALILRFLEERSFREVGEALGLNENGARQRALRALERLRQFFRKRGIVYPVALLAMAFAAKAGECIPVLKFDSMEARELADAVLDQTKHRRIRITASAVSVMVLILLFGLFAVRRESQIELIARRRAIEAVDMALWRGDGTAFASSISFGKADPARARAALAQYCMAFCGLRRSFDLRFDEAGGGWIGALRLLALMAGERMREQPTRIGKDHAIDRIVPGYSMHLVRENNAWRWELFEKQTEEQAERFLREIERQAKILKQLSQRAEAGEFNGAGDMAKAILSGVSGDGHQANANAVTDSQ